MPGRTLVVGAYPPELIGIEGVETEAIGIGLIDAAAGIARAIERARPAHIILCGTCGAYAARAIGSIVIVDRALWIEPTPGIDVPSVVVTEARADESLAADLAAAVGAPRVTAACHAGVTVDDDLARALAARAQVEHMECFAVFRACALAQVPAVAVLAVANLCGRGARESWRANRLTAESAAISAVKSALSALRDP